MELHLGRMSNKDLAEWFGIKPNSFTQHKRKKLEELKNFCFFEEVYGGVNIMAIINPTYVKNSQQIREVYEQGFEELKQPIDTVSHINNQIYEKYYDKLPTLSSAASGYRYAIEVRNANYGVPFKGNGSKGCCYYLWCKMEEKDGKQFYIQFTEEEDKIKQDLLKKHFGTNEEKDLLIAEMVSNGEISKEDAYDIMMEYRNLNGKGFMGFLKELEKQIGAKVVKATKFEETLYFDEKDKPAAIADSTQP
jgi:hypothetical protein